MSDSLPKPKYLWLPTFEGKPDDFSGWDETIRFGRIMKHFQHGFWHWHLNGTGLGGGDGQCATGREAASALEAAYDEIKARLIESQEFEALRSRHGPGEGRLVTAHASAIFRSVSAFRYRPA